MKALSFEVRVHSLSKKSKEREARNARGAWLSSRARVVLLAAMSFISVADLVSAQRPAIVVDHPLNVIATIKPIHALAAAVLGDIAQPSLLIEGAASPHTYALKPSQVGRLNAAHVVVMVSGDLESFMTKVTATLPKTVRTVRLDQAPGLVRLRVRAGGLFEGEDHDHDHAHGAAKATATPNDAHLWLDPENGKAILTHLASVFAEVAPAHKAVFEANARAAAERIDRLRDEISRDLKPVIAKPFIVFHDAYQYFEHRFGLTTAGSITLNPDVQPGAKRLKSLRTRLEKGGTVCVFAEPQFEPKLVATLIEGTAVRRGTLDPIGVALPAGPAAYESLLRGLASDLKACLAAPS
jgi:zinc transport system substrate-binding protein